MDDSAKKQNLSSNPPQSLVTENSGQSDSSLTGIGRVGMGGVSKDTSAPGQESVGSPKLQAQPDTPVVKESVVDTAFSHEPPPLQSVMSAPPPPPMEKDSPSGAFSMPPPKKRRFSNVYFIVIAVVIILAGLGFLAWKFLPDRFSLGRSGEIIWWGLWEEEATVMPLIEKYQEQNPKVKITYLKQSPINYKERLLSSLATGEGPDMFRFHNSWVPMLKNDLDPMPASVMTAEEYSNIYYPVIVSDMTSGVGIVGIPLGYDAITLFVNEDIFASAGKTPPETWDDFRILARELTTKDETGALVVSGTALGRPENVDHWQEILALMMIQNGVNLAKPESPLATDSLTFFSLFSTSEKLWNQTLPPSTVSFASGKVAMYFAPSWRVFEIRQLNPEMRFRTVKLPQLPKDDPTEPDVSYATYWVEGVWNRSENKDAAWDFLKFMSSQESLQELYENARKTRLFGEPYPRIDMADRLRGDPLVGSIIELAPFARSWYLVSRTFDGDTGINTQINKYFEDALNRTLGGGVSRAIGPLQGGVSQVLNQFGIVAR